MTELAKGLTKEQILAFINQFKGAESVFMNGMCFWFAHILQVRFDWCGAIIYDPCGGHFYWRYDFSAYDIEGEHEIPKHNWPLDVIEDKDPAWYARLLRDSILKV